MRGFEDDGEYLIFPRGCLGEIEGFLTDESIQFSLVNHSNSGKAINVEFKLLSTQEEAVKNLFNSDNGILSATTGFGIGKTVVAAALIAKKKVEYISHCPS